VIGRALAAVRSSAGSANLELLAGRLIPIIGNYEPDLAALRRSSTRIEVGVGDESTAADADPAPHDPGTGEDIRASASIPD
jgi:hypothetical protein